MIDCRQYLITDYKIHVKKNSRVADHCAQHSLSEPLNENLQQLCSQNNDNERHLHDQLCENCENCKSFLSDLGDTVQAMIDTEMAREIKNVNQLRKLEESLLEIVESEKKIMELKKHIVRSFWSEMQRRKIIENLNPSTALLTLDWAQKILPQRHLESQKASFNFLNYLF